MLWSNGHKTYDLQKLRRDLAPAFTAKTSGIVWGSSMGHDWLMIAYGYHWSIKKSKKSWEFLYSESVTLWNVILKQTVKFFVKHSLCYCSSILFASASGQSFIERDGIQVNCIIYSSSVHLNLQWKQETLLRAVEWSSNNATNSCGCLPSVVIIASCAFDLTALAYSLLEILSIATGNETVLYWVRSQMIKRQRKNLFTFKTADMENGAEIWSRVHLFSCLRQ